MSNNTSKNLATKRFDPMELHKKWAYEAYKDAYNPKNRNFIFGGKTSKIPTSCKEEDILYLCLKLKGLSDINLKSELQPIYLSLKSS